MKKAVRNWTKTLKNFLLEEDAISFYTFFTILLAECAFLWSNYSSTIAVKFTLILVAYIVNVLISAKLKGMWENDRKEVVFAIMYVVIFAIIFIIGCFINVLMNIILIAIPLIITFLWINIRILQNTTLLYNPTSFWGRIEKNLTDLFDNNKIAYWISQIFVIGIPVALFVYFLATIQSLPIVLKILIPIGYIVLMPYIAYEEDWLGACNIFQIAYDITWTKEYEEWSKNFDRFLDQHLNEEQKKQFEENLANAGIEVITEYFDNLKKP